MLTCSLSITYHRFIIVIVCSLKAYIVLTFLDSFRNESGKLQPIWTKVGIPGTCTAQGLTMFTKFWARSAKWRRNGGLGRVPDAGFFVSTRRLLGNFATADFYYIWP